MAPRCDSLPSDETGRPSRTLFSVLTLGTGLSAAAVLWSMLGADGMTLAEGTLSVLYGILMLWIGAKFWLSFFGAGRILWHDHMKAVPAETSSVEPFPVRHRTAIVIPVYGEQPADVFSRVRSMYRSLESEGLLRGFEFHVLSDTRDPDIWLAEELEWLEACGDLGAEGRLFYRRRLRNAERKSGNIADFLERWGAHYDYMVVLDADSLMDGPTLVEMVRRMEEDPDLGLIQAWPRQVRGTTLFARLQQFASAVHGPLMASGMSWLLGDDGNYWGHNAIIRVQAFVNSCGLPHLPGREPLGGEILSHDFVEAALLRRQGWKLRVDDDLLGSYEEGPPDLIEHARRERRWCQGNIQHLKLIGAAGFKPVSRINFLIGVVAYAAAPLWLIFLAAGALATAMGSISGLEASPFVTNVFNYGTVHSGSVNSGPVLGEGTMTILLVLTVVLLFGPKLLGLVTVLASKARRRSLGGGIRAAVGVFLETVFSTLLAPVMLLLHSLFVGTILCGRSVRWNPQRRGAADVGWADAWRAHQGILAGGCGFLAAFAIVAPNVLPWFLPIIAGLICVVPLAVWTSRSNLGSAFRRSGLLAIPEEAETGPEILRQVADEHARRPNRTPRTFYRRLLEDARFNALHCALVGESGGEASEELGRLLVEGPDRLDPAAKERALRDIAALRWWHAVIWTTRANSPAATPAGAGA